MRIFLCGVICPHLLLVQPAVFDSSGHWYVAYSSAFLTSQATLPTYPKWHIYSRVSISWLYPCNKSSYIRFFYSQYHVDWFKCTEQNVNNHNLTQVSQLYVHVSFCLKVNRSWHNLPTGWWSWSCDLHAWSWRNYLFTVIDSILPFGNAHNAQVS